MPASLAGLLIAELLSAGAPPLFGPKVALLLHASCAMKTNMTPQKSEAIVSVDYGQEVPKERTETVSVRLPESVAERLQSVADALETQHPGLGAGKSVAARMAMMKGLEVLWVELGLDK